MKKTVVLDFDGVIHSYLKGWTRIDNIPDSPVPGIKEAIDEIRKEYKVVVCSTRCSDPKGKEAILKYLNEHNIIVDKVAAEKPPAVVYVDDRAICFNGHAETLLEKIQNFKPWNHQSVFYPCNVFGNKCIYTRDKIDWEKYGSLNLYELIADEYCNILAIQTRTDHNFYGTVLSKVKLVENRERYYVVNSEYGAEFDRSEDIEIYLTTPITVQEYIKGESYEN